MLTGLEEVILVHIVGLGREGEPSERIPVLEPYEAETAYQLFCGTKIIDMK